MQTISKIAEAEKSWEIGEWEEGSSRLAQVRGGRVTNEAEEACSEGKEAGPSGREGMRVNGEWTIHPTLPFFSLTLIL